MQNPPTILTTAPIEPFALRIDPTTTSTPTPIDALPFAPTPNTPAPPTTPPAPPTPFTWHHLDRTDPHTARAIRDDPHITDYAADALLAEDTRPRVLPTADALVVILRGANLNPNADASDMLALRIWLDHERIITLAMHPLRAVDDTRHDIALPRSPIASPADTLAHLANRLTARMEPALNNIATRLDAIEETLLTGTLPPNLRRDLADLRREAANFRRYLAPQNDAIDALARLQSPFLTPAHQKDLAELAQQVRRDVEDLDAAREQAIVANDEFNNRHNDALNKRMYLLSLVAVIVLPLSLITGLLGMNVQGIPGSNTSTGFLAVCLILAAIAAAITITFRLLKWL